MILVLVRHGIAEDAPPGGRDRDRRLTPRGRSRMRQIAAGLRRLKLRPATIVTSPLPRAAETAVIVGEVLGCRSEPRALDPLATGTTPEIALRALRPLAHDGPLMVVGHEPTLSGLASLILTGSADALAIDLRKGGVVVIDLDQLLPTRGAALRAVLTPRQLRAMAR